mgnify:CR=1 FL=1
MLAREFADSAHDKEEASELTIGGKTDNMVIDAEKGSSDEKSEDERILIKDNVGSEPEPEKISARTKLDGPKVVGKIDLDKKKKEEAKEEKPAKEEAKKELESHEYKAAPNVTPGDLESMEPFERMQLQRQVPQYQQYRRPFVKTKNVTSQPT